MESFRVGVAPDLYVNAGPFSTNSIDSNVGFDLPWNPATIDQLIGNDDGKLHRSEYLSFYSEFDNDLYTNDTDLFYAKYGARFDALQSYAESMCVASAKSVDNFQNMQFCSGLDSRGDVDIKTLAMDFSKNPSLGVNTVEGVFGELLGRIPVEEKIKILKDIVIGSYSNGVGHPNEIVRGKALYKIAKTDPDAASQLIMDVVGVGKYGDGDPSQFVKWSAARALEDFNIKLPTMFDIAVIEKLVWMENLDDVPSGEIKLKTSLINKYSRQFGDMTEAFLTRIVGNPTSGVKGYPSPELRIAAMKEASRTLKGYQLRRMLDRVIGDNKTMRPGDENVEVRAEAVKLIGKINLDSQMETSKAMSQSFYNALKDSDPRVHEEASKYIDSIAWHEIRKVFVEICLKHQSDVVKLNAARSFDMFIGKDLQHLLEIFEENASVDLQAEFIGKKLPSDFTTYDVYEILGYFIKSSHPEVRKAVFEYWSGKPQMRGLEYFELAKLINIGLCDPDSGVRDAALNSLSKPLSIDDIRGQIVYSLLENSCCDKSDTLAESITCYINDRRDEFVNRDIICTPFYSDGREAILQKAFNNSLAKVQLAGIELLDEECVKNSLSNNSLRELLNVCMDSPDKDVRNACWEKGVELGLLTYEEPEKSSGGCSVVGW